MERLAELAGARLRTARALGAAKDLKGLRAQLARDIVDNQVECLVALVLEDPMDARSFASGDRVRLVSRYDLP